ncbi:MAG: S-layer homology domain-containing protein, partial [Bacillota bacterium]
ASAADLTNLYIGSGAAVSLPTTDGYYTFGTNSGGAGTASNQASLPADGWTWAVQYNAWASVKYTLTLNNAAITTNYCAPGSLMAAIHADGDLDVVLLGVNTVTGLDGTNSYSSGSFGVYVSGSLTVGGSGSLTANAGKAPFAMSGGIFATNSITISGGTITAIGGYGARSFGLGTIYNGGDSIAISGGTVTAIGSETGGSSSCGIWTYTVSITGGIVTTTGIINGVSANTININNGEGDGLLIAKGRQHAATSVPTCGSGSAALSGSPSDYTGVWGVSAIYPSANILNSTLNLSTWSDDATTYWNASTGGYKTETVGEVKTLTLKNVIINTPDNFSGNNWGIILPSENVNIVLEGVNIVNAGNANSSSYSYGIWGDDSNISVSGDNLIVLSGTGAIGSSGLYAGASLSIESAKVVALSDRTYPNNSSAAIRSDGAVFFSGGTTIAVGEGDNGNSMGVQSGDSVSITGGTTIAAGVFGSNCYGVYAEGTESSISITGGTTIAAGVLAGSNSYGVYAEGSVNITGGNGTAFTTGAYPGTSKKAFNNSPQGNETHVPVLTAGSWTENSAIWNVWQRATTPNATIDYVAEKLTGLTASAAYEVNSTADAADADGKITIQNAWLGTTISLVQKGDGTSTVDSAAKSITLAARPAAPSCTAVQPSASSATGTASGITTDMQYSINGGTSWTDGTGTDVTGLNPGTVLVRVKATPTTPAGLSQSITITAYTAPPSSGGGSTRPALVTKIDNGGSTTNSNIGQLVSDGKTLTVNGDKGAKLVFNTEALKGIDGQTSGSIKVEMKDVSPAHQENLPGKQVFSLTVSSGSSTITNFGGSVTVTLPYTLKDGETANEVTVWYLAGNGGMTEVPCTYDPATELATFTVNHFSLYVVGVGTPWVNPFTDVSKNDWFYNAVKFANQNGLFAGTGADTFSPDSALTRAMLWTVLGRMDGQSLSGSGVFEAARSWAMGAGITDGTNPDGCITREQMVTILWRYAGSPKVDSGLSNFSDVGSVASYAADAMAWAVENGMIAGANGALMPQGNATRAQVATILQQFIAATVK